MHEFHRVFAGIRHASEQHLVKRNAQAVKIRTIVHRAIHASGLFRRHVRKRAFQFAGAHRHRGFAGNFRRDAEVDVLNNVAFRYLSEYNVVRFDVFVNHLLAVNLSESFGA